MIPYALYTARQPRERVYRKGTRPAREVAIHATARRSRPTP
jgi:hypothetical protein